MKATINISILSLALLAQSAYSQQQSSQSRSTASEQLKITRVSNRENFLENRIASLEYDTRRTADLWICLYTLPQEGTLHDTVRISLGDRTVSVPAEVVTEQRTLEVEKDHENSSLDYTTAQSAHSATSTSSPTLQVNPDGTNSTVHYQGDTKLVVNPNGSQTVLPNDETSSIVSPEGKKQMQKMNTTTTLVVNPDGSHSTIFHSAPLTTSTSTTRKKENATLVPVNYSRLHIQATPALLKQLKQAKTLAWQVQLSGQTIELAMYTRPLERYQKKLAAAEAGGKTQR
ncbi:hypothetical protein KK062_18630 [Fulvivirgaceae bacterium PWU5]|uniref:Uncharacterized protein n=1 Tax=Dawidia cretensis TaxID=2782350 RepID=A0AAP2DZ39_9BACT|nr:hypothetical protein [Dawidia cretensis]MBT1710270.1 hypothetical protein [Dawidia cretensis]